MFSSRVSENLGIDMFAGRVVNVSTNSWPLQGQVWLSTRPILTLFKANSDPLQGQLWPSTRPIMTLYKAKFVPLQGQVWPSIRPSLAL